MIIWRIAWEGWIDSEYNSRTLPTPRNSTPSGGNTIRETLSAHGPSGHAAILFPSLVKVSSVALFRQALTHSFSALTLLRIFNLLLTSVRYGSLSPRTTEPQAFFLGDYFSTSFIRPCSPKPQLKNTLVPTRIAYAGGQVEFRVDMGSEVCHIHRLFLIEFFRFVAAYNSLGHYPRTIWISVYGCFWRCYCRLSESPAIVWT